MTQVATESEPATLKLRRAYLDCCQLKDSKTDELLKKTWRLIVVAPHNFKVSHIFPTKDGMVEPTVELLNQWQQQGIGISYLRMDNAGENLRLEKRLKSTD